MTQAQIPLWAERVRQSVMDTHVVSRKLQTRSRLLRLWRDHSTPGAGGTTRLCDWSDPLLLEVEWAVKTSSGTCPLPDRRVLHATASCVDYSTSVADALSDHRPADLLSGASWAVCAHSRRQTGLVIRERAARLSFEASSAFPAVLITAADCL